MTAEVDMPFKGEIEDQCGLDMSDHHDLPNGKATAAATDGSFVLVADRNEDCVVKEADNGVAELTTENRQIDYCLHQEQVGGTSANADTGPHVEEVKESSQDLQETLQPPVAISEAADSECKLLQVVESSQSTETFEKSRDSEPTLSGPEHFLNHKKLESEENGEFESVPYVTENGKFETITQHVQEEPGELNYEEVASGDVGVDLERELKLPHLVDQSEVVNNPDSDFSGDALPINHAPHAVSETILVDDSVNSNEGSQQQNGSVENVESLCTTPSCEILTVEICNSIPTASNNGAVVNLTTLGTQTVESPEVALIPVTDVGIKNSVIKGSVSDQSREDLPNFHASQSAPVENGTSDITERLVGVNVSVGCPVLVIGTVEVPNVQIRVPRDAEALPACATDGVGTETEDGNISVGSSEYIDSHCVDNLGQEKVQNCPLESDNASIGQGKDMGSESETGFCSIESEDKVSNPISDDVDTEPKVSKGITEYDGNQTLPADNTNAESYGSDSVKTESSLPACVVANVKEESDAENTSSVSGRNVPEEGLGCKIDSPDCSVVGREGAPDCVPEVASEEQLPGEDDNADDKTSEEVVAVKEENLTSSPEGSTMDASDGQKNGAEVVKGLFFLIKVPRFDDNDLKEQIAHAESEVREKTQARDAIQAELQRRKAACKGYSESFEVAVSDERALRELFRSKRQEIDSVQSMFSTATNAISVEDIDGRISNIQHMLEHETLPLKEEKQFIREINKLKQHRDQLSSTMGSKEEIQQALVQKDQIEQQLKVLKKEVDLLREKLRKAEEATKTAKKIYHDESNMLNELQDQFRTANQIRQEAYARLQNLKKQKYERNRSFYGYKDDFKVANELALKGDREALQRICDKQVDRVMELWNSNDDFRGEYTRCNIRSTLRRLKTLDGRALGPDEQPPVIPNVVNHRVAKTENPISQIPNLGGEKQEVVSMKAVKTDDKAGEKVGEAKNQMAKSKKPAKPAPSRNSLATVSGRDEIVEEVSEEERKRSKKEEELARKEEELSKAEEAAKLREQRRLEEKMKAKEAQERKKRKADKAQAKAAIRAQKEAEEKEKEREKRAKKKEKKKAATLEDTNAVNEGEDAPCLETPKETPKESQTSGKSTIAKRPKKPSVFKKQTKLTSMPLPLRNRGKRRLQPWMWVLIAAFVIFVLFLVGNSSSTIEFGLPRFGF